MIIQCLNCGQEVTIIEDNPICPNCSFSYIPDEKITNKKTKTLILAFHRKYTFKNLQLETYSHPRKNISRRKLDWQTLVIFWKNKIYHYNMIPICKICKIRRVTVNKRKKILTEYCPDRSCISKYTMQKQDPKKLYKLYRQSIRNKYNVDNISSLTEIKQKKSKKLKQYWGDKNKRIERYNNMFRKFGYFNVSQRQQRELLQLILSKINCIEEDNVYLCYLRKLFEQLKLDGVIDIDNYDDLIYKLKYGKNYFTLICPKCGLKYIKQLQSPIAYMAYKLNIEGWNYQSSSLNCPRCYSSRSRIENYVIDKIKEILEGTEFKIHTNIRRYTKPFEIDIVTEFYDKYKIGFEINGLFWHSTAHIKASVKNYEEFVYKTKKWIQQHLNKYHVISKLQFPVYIIHDYEIFDTNFEKKLHRVLKQYSYNEFIKITTPVYLKFWSNKLQRIIKKTEIPINFDKNIFNPIWNDDIDILIEP